MMKHLVIFALLNVIISLSFSQNKRIYKDLKEKYESIYNFQDSFIFIESKSKNRFRTDSNFVDKSLFKINSDLYVTSYYLSKMYGEYLYVNDSVYYRYFKNDTFKLRNIGQHLNIKAKNYPNEYYRLFITIPTKENSGFSRWKYKKAKITILNHDTIIIEQSIRKSSRKRLFFVNQNLNIYKIININNDSNEADEYWEHSIKYIAGNNLKFDSLNSYFGLGKYSNYKIKSFSKKDSLYKYKSDSTKTAIPLLNGQSLSIDSTKETYILLDYWYFGCGPCMQMMPFMINLDKIVDTSKLHILGVNEIDKASDILKFFSNRNSQYLQMDCNKMLPFHQINSHPTLILVDSKFNIIKIWVGYSQYQQKQIERYLREMGLLK